jgi:hypothetical protein
MSTEMIRQGDLLFVRATIPDDAKEIEDGVLARGEATGHTHRVRAGTALAYMVGVVAYVRSLQEAYIDHEEHNTVVLPTGEWEVRRQREYVPDGWRQVGD